MPTLSEPQLLPPDLGVWQRRLRTGDVDAHARAQPHWRQHYEQLSGGSFNGALHHVQLPGLRLVREDCDQALHQRGDLGRDAYGLAMPLAMSGQAIFNGQRVVLDSIMVGRGDDLDLVTPQRFSLIAVVVDAELLTPLWQRMYQKPLPQWLESQLVVPARAAAAEALRRLHLQAMQQLEGVAAASRDDTAMLQLRDAVLMEWIEALPERVDAGDLPQRAARRQLVERACERMLSRTDEPLTMLQVCRELGVSRRKLNYCFREVLGTSPVKYLRALRLNGVRREIAQGASSVQDAAACWGFWQLGQFADDYRRQFGELPSQTLRARG
jgi:AraC family ethanolamine operon transcriptional activator